jgi:hypothetical protein
MLEILTAYTTCCTGMVGGGLGLGQPTASR